MKNELVPTMLQNAASRVKAKLIPAPEGRRKIAQDVSPGSVSQKENMSRKDDGKPAHGTAQLSISLALIVRESSDRRDFPWFSDGNAEVR